MTGPSWELSAGMAIRSRRKATISTSYEWAAAAISEAITRHPFRVGQDGILRGDWQSPRGPSATRPADCQSAPHSGKPQTVLAILRGLGGRVQERQAG